jgi:hypothetical protein
LKLEKSCHERQSRRVHSLVENAPLSAGLLQNTENFVLFDNTHDVFVNEFWDHPGSYNPEVRALFNVFRDVTGLYSSRMPTGRVARNGQGAAARLCRRIVQVGPSQAAAAAAK